MDDMKVVDKENIMRYRIDPNNIVFGARLCQHRYNDENRCKFCGLTSGQILADQQANPTHNQN